MTAASASRLDQGRLVLGTVQLGMDYGAANSAGQPHEEEAAAVLRAAAEAGITHLDTARVYGDAEERIGQAMAGGVSGLRVITKIRPLDDLAVDVDPEGGRAAVLASARDSLAALGIETVAGLLTHRAADWRRPGVLDALVACQEAGLAQVVGVSISSPEELVAALEEPALGYVQLPFNLLDRRWFGDRAQAALTSRPEVVVTVRSAFLQGLLVSPAASWPSNAAVAPREVWTAIDALVGELDRHSPVDLCLAYVFGHDWVSSVVIGAESPEQVKDCAELARQTPLSAEEMEHVRTVLPAGNDDLVDPSRWRRS